jgi:hypothetical protein
MDITDEGAIEKSFAGLNCIDHGLISAGIMLNGTIMHIGHASPWLVPIVSSSSQVYTACRKSDVFRNGGNGQA